MLVRPIRLPLESAEGFRLRAAAANGLRRPKWLKLASEGGAQAASLAAPLRTSRFARFCPLCLSDKPVWLEAWTCAVIPVCLRHAVVLKARCDGCGRPLTWGRARLRHCMCGANLSQQPTQRLSGSTARFTAMLHDEDGVLRSDCPGFGKLTLAEASRLILAVGAPLAWPESRRPMRALRRSSLKDCFRVYSAVARVLEDWPTSFIEYLKDRMRTALRQGRKGPSIAFERLRTALKVGEPRGSLAFVQAQLDEFLAQYWPYGLDRRNRSGQLASAREVGYLPLAAAARFLSMRPVRLLALARRHGVEVRTAGPGPRRGFRYVAAADLEWLQDCAGDEISPKAAAKLLGVSRQRLVRLVRGKRLGGWFSEGTRSVAAVSRCSVDRLVRDVIAHAARRPASDGAMRKFDDAVRLHVPLSETVDFFDALRMGRIRAALAAEDRGLRGLCVSADDLRRERANDGRSVHGLTIRQAAHRLGLKEEVVHGLVRRHLIRSAVGPGRHRRQNLISEIDIQRFKARYVSASQLAREFQTSPRSAVRCLERAGLRPVTGPTVDGSRQYFFARHSCQTLRLECNGSGTKELRNRAQDARPYYSD